MTMKDTLRLNSNTIFYSTWVFGLLVTIIILHYRNKSPLQKINGPRGNMLVGQGLVLPPKATQRLREWAQEYGEVYKIRIGWYNWVVLSSPEAIKEVFDKQMPAPMGELVVGGMRMLTMPYGPKWRAYRTLVHNLLKPQTVQSFVPIQTIEIKRLIYDLAVANHSNAAFYGHVRRALFSIMMTAVYGRRIESADDKDLKLSEKSGKLLGMLSRAGTFIEDEIPFLAKLPTWMQPSRKKALEHAKWVLWVKMRMWNALQEQFDQGIAPVCYGSDIMRSDYVSQGLQKEDCAWIAGGEFTSFVCLLLHKYLAYLFPVKGLVEAGSQTSAATLTNLILYLAATPQAQEEAFQELEKVCGDSRAPVYDDLANLPYINACVKEILRLCPAPPWILRHFTDAAVVYKDFVIPKGTAVVANTAAIHFDPSQYTDPFQFKPERYLNHTKRAAEYAAMADPYERDHFTFGAGRRICPGSRFAENMIMLALANMVWAFEIKPPPVGETGDSKELAEMDLSEDAFDPAPLKSAKPFKVTFMPRSESRLNMIR
ncbi:Cytochrome P450 monooxygenase patH [Lachnellula arida]|uniref:Cytochrome P450 monooxygenase patH n=1 Tax=Lachnellula arida TaxID=1316785 RepID=A0A8T9BNV2_9HELO|nr:Cytochrome P450 monooxygenase patH [Lachnellula arida]